MIENNSLISNEKRCSLLTGLNTMPTKSIIIFLLTRRRILVTNHRFEY